MTGKITKAQAKRLWEKIMDYHWAAMKRQANHVVAYEALDRYIDRLTEKEKGK